MSIEESLFSSLENASPLMLVGMVLLLVLAALKRIPWYPNWSIPITSLVLGIISYCVLTGWNAKNIILGLIIGGFPVGAHQTCKQILLQKECVKKGNTEWFTKKEIERAEKIEKKKAKKKKSKEIIYN